MELEVFKTDGIPSGNKVELSKTIFEAKPNDHLIYQAVRSQMTNQRQGTVATKNRSQVRGGGRKPWRQKGRGTARVGTIRSPLWAGGGRIFGPQPRDLKMKLTKKMKKLARISAFSYKANQNQIMLLEDVQIETPKTRELFQILKNLNLDGKKILLLLNNIDENVLRSGRNIPNLAIRLAADTSTYDILDCEVLLIEKDALDKITEVCTL
ncbi:MAG: 50S ribosomal protein L4 [bacterium]|nr:50S ribosomal protein L4 [bacterium]